MSQVNLPKEVIDQVNDSLIRAVLSTPDYVTQLINGLMHEKNDSSYNNYNDPDRGKNLFEKILRRELRNLIDQSVTKNLRLLYADEIDALVAKEVAKETKVDGSMAYALANMISQDYKVSVTVNFEIKPVRSHD